MAMTRETLDWNKLHENMKASVEEAGYFFISDRPMSTHPDDWYLRFAFGFKMMGNVTEYASWVYNASIGDKGCLNSGHYIWDQRDAYDDYLARR
jgi:hypothetical protein